MDLQLISQISDHKTRLVGFWQSRDVAIKEERIMLSLPEPQIKKNMVAARLNSCRVLYDTSVSLISGYEPRIRLPLHGQNADQRDKMSKAERFLIGIFRELSRQNRRLGKDSFFRELAYYICSGWYAAFPHLDDGNNFRCDLYDPLTIYPEWDGVRLIRLVRTYRTTRNAAHMLADAFEYQLAGLTSESDNIEVINYWEHKKGSVYNCILVDGKPVKPWVSEDFDEIPILVGSVGGSPAGPFISQDQTLWLQQRGASVIAANKSLYRQADAWMSLFMQLVQTKAQPQVQDFTESGEASLKPEDVGPGQIHHRRIGEEIKPIDLSGSTFDVNQLLSFLSGELQRGGIPYVVYGGLPFEVSGFALSQLLSAIKHKLSPYMNAYAAVLGDVAAELMRQFRLKGKKIELLVEKPERRNKGETFIEDFIPDDIPTTSFVDISAPIALPTDKAQQFVLARQAIQQPQLMSRPTLWDELLDVQDYELEYKRIIDDQMMELPVMKTITLIERLRDKAEFYKKQNLPKVADAINRYADQVELTISQPQAEAPSGQAPGMNPEMMSQETAMGGMPDAIKAAIGMKPPGDNGSRPGTTGRGMI